MNRIEVSFNLDEITKPIEQFMNRHYKTEVNVYHPNIENDVLNIQVILPDGIDVDKFNKVSFELEIRAVEHAATADRR